MHDCCAAYLLQVLCHGPLDDLGACSLLCNQHQLGAQIDHFLQQMCLMFGTVATASAGERDSLLSSAYKQRLHGSSGASYPFCTVQNDQHT